LRPGVRAEVLLYLRLGCCAVNLATSVALHDFGAEADDILAISSEGTRVSIGSDHV